MSETVAVILLVAIVAVIVLAAIARGAGLIPNRKRADYVDGSVTYGDGGGSGSSSSDCGGGSDGGGGGCD